MSFVLSVTSKFFAECQCHYAECRYAKWHCTLSTWGLAPNVPKRSANRKCERSLRFIGGYCENI